MRIDWNRLQNVMASFNDEAIKRHISVMIHEYLVGTQTQTLKEELISLGILTENPTPIENRRNIVQPFNFVSNNDGAQSN